MISTEFSEFSLLESSGYFEKVDDLAHGRFFSIQMLVKLGSLNDV